MASSAAAAVRAVLSAAGPLERLGAGGELPERPRLTDLQRAYRRAAFLIHPDKCELPQATRAFQLLSEAFEAAAAPSAGRRDRDGAAAPQSSKKEGRRAWWEGSFAEWDRQMLDRERAAAAMQARFRDSARAGYAAAALRRHIAQAEVACMRLDLDAGVSDSEWWPFAETAAYRSKRDRLQAQYDVARLSSRREFIDPAAAALRQLDAPLHTEALQGRMLGLLSHLRAAHHYCFWCGRQFDSAAQLTTDCPGIAEEDHEGSAQGAPGDGAAAAGDPLDTFMAEVEREAARDRSAAGAPKRRRKR